MLDYQVCGEKVESASVLGTISSLWKLISLVFCFISRLFGCRWITAAGSGAAWVERTVTLLTSLAREYAKVMTSDAMSSNFLGQEILSQIWPKTWNLCGRLLHGLWFIHTFDLLRDNECHFFLWETEIAITIEKMGTQPILVPNGNKLQVWLVH